MTVCERMFLLLDRQNKKPADLCRAIGVGTAQTTSWKKRNTDPPPKYIPAIADFLDVSIEYLVTGVDKSTSRLTELEAEMLTMFRELPIEKRHEFVGELKGYLRATKPADQDKVG